MQRICIVLQGLGALTLLLYAIHLMVKPQVCTVVPSTVVPSTVVTSTVVPLAVVRSPFSVRILVPCYKEDIETLEETLVSAVAASVAAMTSKPAMVSAGTT